MSDEKDTNVFARERKPFQAMGKQYYFEFIPSIHLTDVMSTVIAALTNFDMVGTEAAPKKDAKVEVVFPQIIVLIKERIYKILYDVLLWQNDERVEVENLKYKVSALELAQFTALVMSDGEVERSVETIADGLGKLIGNLTGANDSVMPKSTPSS